jgi:hypothetical protein
MAHLKSGSPKKTATLHEEVRGDSNCTGYHTALNVRVYKFHHPAEPRSLLVEAVVVFAFGPDEERDSRFLCLCRGGFGEAGAGFAIVRIASGLGACVAAGPAAWEGRAVTIRRPVPLSCLPPRRRASS